MSNHSIKEVKKSNTILICNLRNYIHIAEFHYPKMHGNLKFHFFVYIQHIFIDIIIIIF